jgi:uncharacterized protein (TIGR03437 family)
MAESRIHRVVIFRGRFSMLVAGAILFGSALVKAQPFIYYRGVANAASYMAGGLPGGAIARGSAFSIFGSDLGPSSTPTLSFPLQTTLAGVSITVTQGSTTVNAIPIFLAPGQINAIMPSNAPTGSVSLRVTYNGLTSNPVPAKVVNSSVGIFSVNSQGAGPGILDNFVDSSTAPINSLQTPAKPGQVVILWGTGLGPVTFPDNVAPSAGSLPLLTEVFVGGVKADVQYSGRTPCCAGIDQVVFTVPSQAPLGCWVPVYVRTGGSAVSNFVTLAISSDGSPCHDPGNSLAAALINGGKIGTYAATRFAVRHDVAVLSTLDASTDVLGAYQAREKLGPFNFNPMFSLPPAGACTAYSVVGDPSTDANAIVPGMTPPTGAALDSGSLRITGAKGSKNAQSNLLPGLMLGDLAGSISGLPLTNTTFLDPGGFMLSLAGGKDIGPASANFTVPPPFTWTNRDQVSPITRSSGFTVNWTGGDPNASVFVMGAGLDLPSNSTALFLCLAPPGAGSFTVPADLLANVPAPRPRLVQSKGVVYVGQWNLATPEKMQSSGLDFSAIVPAFVSGTTVSFR